MVTKQTWSNSLISNNKKLFIDSENAESDNTHMAEFFNGSSMARIIDVFLDNPKTPLSIADLARIANISRKSIAVNAPTLIKMKLIQEKEIGVYRFYEWQSKSSLAKHLQSFRSIISDNNA